MQLNCGFNLLKARMDRVISMLERMAVKVTFASDVQKLDGDSWFWMLLIFDAVESHLCSDSGPAWCDSSRRVSRQGS